MHPLDNVVWKALTTCQARLAEGSALARRFPREITLLAAIPEPSPQAYQSLIELLSERKSRTQSSAKPATVCLFFDKTPEMPDGFIIENSAPMFQMVCDQKARTPAATKKLPIEFSTLGAADSPEMVALAQLTKPGPFGPRTYELGTYLGIRNGEDTSSGTLVAMAGERLRVPGFTEISAVCTHPSRLGHGYAALLMTELMRRIVARGEQPFLHVRADNTRAVELYRRLGFKERVLWYYAVVCSKA